MNDSERDELLIRLDERTKEIDRKLTEHLKRHWQIYVIMLGTLFAAVASWVK